MKLWAVALLLSTAWAWEIDGLCNRTGGESCMDSPDCSFCNITTGAALHYSGTRAVLTVTLTNNEPAEVPLLLNVIRDGQKIHSKQVDLLAGQTNTREFRLDREAGNSSLLIEVRDRDILTAWGRESLVLRGMESQTRSDVLLPVVSVLAFLAILAYGFRQLSRGRGPYQLMPVFFPAYPTEEEVEEEEEIIVVPRKKKYYYKKG